MKYLKSFNEDITSFSFELQEFCETNLAYLLDDGEVRIDETHTGYIIRIHSLNNMKHIKTFNESVPFNLIERRVQELGELNLSYLEDEGYIITYTITDSIIQQRDIVIEISRVDKNIFSGYLRKDLFSWNNVKDRVIPLIQQLDKDFNVEVEIFDGLYDDKRHHTTDWVINDGPSRWFAPNSIRFIKIKLKSYLFKKGAKL